MSVPWINQTPTHWQDYLPNPDDFATAEEFDAAMRAGAVDTSPTLASGWVNSRAEREPEFAKNAQFHPQATQRSQGVAELNWLFNQPGNGQRNMMLQSYIANHPDIARAAYNAFDEFGNPLVDPAILAMIERQLGIGPQPVVSDNPPVIVVDPVDPSTIDPGNGWYGPYDSWEDAAAANRGVNPDMRATPVTANPDRTQDSIGSAQPAGGGFNQDALMAMFGIAPQEMNTAPMGMSAPQPSTFMAGVPDDLVMRIRQRYGRGGMQQQAMGLGPY